MKHFALALAAVIATALPAFADEVGPSRDVHWIRSMIPQPHERIDDLVISGDYALAQWHDTMHRQGIYVLTQRATQWVTAATITVENNDAFLGSECNVGGATPAFLASAGVPSELVALAAKALPLVATSREPPPPKAGYLPAMCAVESWNLDETAFDLTSRAKLSITFAPSDAPKLSVNAHPTTPVGEEFTFEGTVAGGSIDARVQAGTIIDVTLPFALGVGQRPILVLDGTNEFDSAIPWVIAEYGTISGHTLHFVVPQFSVHPGGATDGQSKSGQPASPAQTAISTDIPKETPPQQSHGTLPPMNQDLLVEIASSVRELRESQARIEKRFDGVDQRLDGIDQRFDGIDQRFDGVDQKFLALENQMMSGFTDLRGFVEFSLGAERAHNDERFDKLETKFGRLEGRVEVLEDRRKRR